MSFTQNPPPQARFYANGPLTAELLGTRITIDYDPVAGTARALFDGQLYLPVENGTYTKLADFADVLVLDFTSQVTRCYGAEAGVMTDPVTGADLTQVSVAGLMTLIKKAYDIEINARAAAAVSGV